MKTTFKEFLFINMPVVGILRNFPLNTIETILPYYKKAGFTTLEITMNSDNASAIIQKLSIENPDMNIGAGTVCNMDDLNNALNAGASFIVTPILDKEVIAYCADQNIPIFPGAFTPTEIYTATKLGATGVKVFPATQLGVSYIKDVLAPLNNMKLLPTGGVAIENIEAFFKAGAYGVGMGGSLFPQKIIEMQDFEALYNHFKAIAYEVSKTI